MRRIVTIILCLAALSALGQNYTSPFDFPLLLSANFGELRPNHFHGGIDVKTGGVTGKPIRSIGDGYVSRALVEHGGFGQAVFVTHPDGLTSVYGHIMEFAPEVQAAVRERQYEEESFTVDLTFGPDEFPVKGGQLIAVSGNEGSSAGPHLHLELRRYEGLDKDRGTPAFDGDFSYIDPLPFFQNMIKDTTAPRAHCVGIYPLRGEGVVGGGTKKKIVAADQLNKPVTAWGKIYTAISANDYMDGTSNKYGVRSVTLYVDDEETFRSVTDEVLRTENRMINGFIDYEDYQANRRLLMRSAMLPGVRLGLLTTADSRGVVTIDEERDYRFRYVLEDAYGNRRTCSFTVRGVRQEIPDYVPRADKMLHWDRADVISLPGLELVAPRGSVYEDTELRTDVKADTAGVSAQYVLDIGRNPLHSPCRLAIAVTRRPVGDESKYYVEQRLRSWRGSAGGTMEDGWMTADVRSLGTFSVKIDTVPPRVTPVGQASWGKTRDLQFKVTDEETGIYKYKVYVDGRFVLFGLKGSTLKICDRDRIERGVPHTAEVVLTDGCGNVTKQEFKF